MLKLFNQVVVDWIPFVWKYEGEFVDQVQVLLYSGQIFIMDLEDFMVLSDDD